jgi:pimeloyl-ACP methyl ester carboxylesterase
VRTELGAAAAAGAGSEPEATAARAPRPFRVRIAQEELDELRDRLERTRWTSQIPGSDWDYGVGLDYLKDLVRYWLHEFDWRAVEDRLNRHPQYLAEIDGERIHFVHARSAEPDAVPLILTHGWPATGAEFLDLVGPLTDPRGHGAGPDAPAFHVVVPSLPGFGFSGPTRQTGWNCARIARAWGELMSRLGYERFGAAGNDVGSAVSIELGEMFPDRVSGAHVTQILSLPAGVPGERDGSTEAEEQGHLLNEWFLDELGAYQRLHAQQPQTLAHALEDSPAGLLAWYCRIYQDGVDPEFIITHVATTYLTRTAGSALRIYFERDKAAPPLKRSTVPLALAMFAQDFVSIRPLAERDHANIVSWNSYDAPGHFASHTSPDLLVNDIREFFGKYRP